MKASDEFVIKLWSKECLKSPKNMTKNLYPIIGCKDMTNLIKRRKQLGHYLDPKSELNTRISILKDYRAECTGLVQVAGSQKDSFDVLQSKCSILVSGQGVVFMYD